MQKSISENQSADGSEGRFTNISERELNFLLESRQSRATKNSTFMLSLLLNVGTKTNSAFKYTLYKRLQTIVRTKIVFHEVNLIIFTLSLPLP